MTDTPDCVDCGDPVEDHEAGSYPIHKDCDPPQQTGPPNPTHPDDRIDPPPNEW